MKFALRFLQVISCIVLALAGLLAIVGVATGETGILVVCIVLGLLCLFLILMTAKVLKTSKLPRPASEFEVCVETIYKDGLGALAPNCYCMLGISQDKLYMKTIANQPPTAMLNLSQITNIDMFSENEIIEKSRSVVGRGLVGGMVFGPVGAIVGGLSGTKNKKHKRLHQYIVLNYIPSDGSDPVAATFERVNPFDKVVFFIQTVRSGITTKTQVL